MTRDTCTVHVAGCEDHNIMPVGMQPPPRRVSAISNIGYLQDENGTIGSIHIGMSGEFVIRSELLFISAPVVHANIGYKKKDGIF